MDEVVRQAMAKWPNVPHCFGWLRLDARGNWRMRDERTQHLGLAGDQIRHPALLDFIKRNYQADDSGQWYFQNGPQRVYVDLELTPYIVHTDPAAGLLLHTGSIMPPLEQAWLTPHGQFILRSTNIIGALDDRDAGSLLAQLYHGDDLASEAEVLDWLDSQEPSGAPLLQLRYAGVSLPLQRATPEQLGQEFDFVAHPRSALTSS